MTCYLGCHCATGDLVSFFGYNVPQMFSELVDEVVRGDWEALQRHMFGSDVTVIEPLQVTDRYCNTALHLSIIFDKLEVFEFLMGRETIPMLDQANGYGQTPMHFAALTGSVYYLTRLIEEGGDVNAADNYGCTPLHASASRLAPKIIQILLDGGADVDARNLRGRTPLFHACEKNMLDTIYRLLYHGASADVSDTDGILPIAAAMRYLEDSPEIPEPDRICHEILFDHTFDDTKGGVGLSNLIIAMKIDFPLFPKMLESVNHVRCRQRDLMKFRASVIYIRQDNFKLFLEKWPHIVDELLEEPVYLLHSALLLADPYNLLYKLTRLMEFMTMLFELKPESNYIQRCMFLVSYPPGLISEAASAYKRKDLSLTVVEQVAYFLYSYGLQCQLSDLNEIYEACGFCELVKFILDCDIPPSAQTPLNIMPYLMYNVNETVHQVKRLKWPDCKPALKFFTLPKAVRSDFENLESFRELSMKLPTVPSLVELSRDAARQHIIKTFKIEKSRDFYRLIKKMPICEDHKKILTYEKELYGIE